MSNPLYSQRGKLTKQKEPKQAKELKISGGKTIEDASIPKGQVHVKARGRVSSDINAAIKDAYEPAMQRLLQDLSTHSPLEAQLSGPDPDCP